MKQLFSSVELFSKHHPSEAATVLNICINALCQMLPEDDAALDLEMDSWKCHPSKPSQTSPEKAGSIINMGTECKGSSHSPSAPWELLLVTQTEQWTNKGALGQTELLSQECQRMAGSSLSQSAHNQLQAGIQRRPFWLVISRGCRLWVRPVSLVSLGFPNSP